MAKKSREPVQPDLTAQHARGAVKPEADGKLTERILEIAEPLRERLEKPVAQVSRWTKRAQALRPYRVYLNYAHSDGNLRAAGMGFQGLFAIFAAVWLGFAVTGLWLSANANIYRALVALINRSVPGLIATPTSSGVIDSALLDPVTAFGWSGALAAIGLLWTAIGWLFYTRQAVRAVFGLSRDTTNYILQKLRDLFLAFGFGLVFLISALLTIASTQALTLVLDILGLGSDSFWTTLATRLSGLLVSVVLNIVTLGAMFRVLARVSIPWRNLFAGTLIGAAVLAGLSALGAVLLGSASANPLLATFGVFIGLLVWFNLVSRVILLSASWIAVGMRDSGLSPRLVTPEQAAAEQAAAEHELRLLSARAELRDAQDQLATASFFARFGAQRRVEKAEHRLNDLLDRPGDAGSEPFGAGSGKSRR